MTFSGTVSVEPNRFGHVTDKDILARLPEAAHDNVYVCDMKALGLDNIGPIPKVGYGWPELPPPLNVVMDGESMHMARYPDKDFVKPSHIFDPGFNPRYDYSLDPTKERGPIWACNDQGLKDMFDLLKLEDDVWTYGYFNHTYADDNVAPRLWKWMRSTASNSRASIPHGTPWRAASPRSSMCTISSADWMPPVSTILIVPIRRCTFTLRRVLLAEKLNWACWRILLQAGRCLLHHH